MCSIGEEDKDGRNGNGWLISPTSKYWNDFPAFWDNRRINISFVDGSTGVIMLESDALKKAWLDDKDGHDVEISDNDVEYKKFKKVLLPGVIGSVLD
jgi:prepilin-type processing-associated H-X9-DG protein